MMWIMDAGLGLTLALLVARVLTNDTDDVLALDDAAGFAKAFH
jgi:hypothetical protein